MRGSFQPSMRVCCRLLALAALAVFLGGCQRKPEGTALNPARVHAITGEMLRAARSVLRENGAVESHLQFDGVHDNRADQVMITTRDQSSRQQTELIQSLDRVATANSLTRDAEIGHNGAVRLVYRDGRVLTHSIAIASSALFPHHRDTPRLAVILDDLGSDPSAAEAIFRLHYPLTISILPNHSHSTEIAREAHQRGYQVMLHLPMQALANEKGESQELRAGMSARDMRFLIDQFLDSVPEASGANNHQGSESTADGALMQKLMPILRDHHLYYVDSRTTRATVAFDTAQSFGLHAAFRNVPFLDDVPELPAVRKQLELALRAARERGESVAIGHPHQATLAALEEVLPQAAPQGVELVFVSDVVH